MVNSIIRLATLAKNDLDLLIFESKIKSKSKRTDLILIIFHQH
jgi:hypothetical protein